MRTKTPTIPTGRFTASSLVEVILLVGVPAAMKKYGPAITRFIARKAIAALIAKGHADLAEELRAANRAPTQALKPGESKVYQTQLKGTSKARALAPLAAIGAENDEAVLISANKAGTRLYVDRITK